MVYGTQRFNAAKKGFSNNPYPETDKNQLLVMIPISLRSIQILSSHLRLGFLICAFPEVLPFKIVIAVLSSSILAT